MNLLIRIAKEDDAEELLKIYSYYVKNTAITFEQKVPSLEEFSNRIKETLINYPYLVAIVDGKIIGYIYASRFRTRESYICSAATSIYIEKSYQRKGIGKKLYSELCNILLKQNITNVYAGAADPIEEDEYLTHNSEYFHKSMGFEIVAKYNKCAIKFGKWYNLIEMEKIIGEHSNQQKDFIPFKSLEKNFL
ncbi:MAG: N-acetyltransferase [Treponema sp.]|nr:N-acetyltransferase [Treponema sp.]